MFQSDENGSLFIYDGTTEFSAAIFKRAHPMTGLLHEKFHRELADPRTRDVSISGRPLPLDAHSICDAKRKT